MFTIKTDIRNMSKSRKFRLENQLKTLIFPFFLEKKKLSLKKIKKHSVIKVVITTNFMLLQLKKDFENLTCEQP